LAGRLPSLPLGAGDTFEQKKKAKRLLKSVPKDGETTVKP